VQAEVKAEAKAEVAIEIPDGSPGKRAVRFQRVSQVRDIATKKLAHALEVEGSIPLKRRLVRQTSQMRQSLRRELRQDLGKSWWWSLKTFKLLPALAQLRAVDMPARLLFPLGYAIYILVMLAEVDAL